jgi:signal transduction histidine kinase
MIENRDSNGVLFPDVFREEGGTWLMPVVAPNLETTLWPVRHSNEGFINFLDIAQLRQREKELRQNQQRLESFNEDLQELVAERTKQVCQLVSEVLITEQKVRDSVSQLLHDDLQQILVGIQMKIQTIRQMLPNSDDQLLQEHMQDLHGTIDLALDVTRQVAVDLGPPILLNEDFMELLDWLAGLMNKRYELKVELKGSVKSDSLKDEVSSFLFQTVRELLFNVVKHARVSEAQVEVSDADGRLTIVVSDYGQGFDVANLTQQPNSLGLFNIRRQLELFGGQFHIESEVGLGTRAVIVMIL